MTKPELKGGGSARIGPSGCDAARPCCNVSPPASVALSQAPSLASALETLAAPANIFRTDLDCAMLEISLPSERA